MEYIVDDQKLDVMDFIEFVNKVGVLSLASFNRLLPIPFFLYSGKTNNSVIVPKK